MRCKKCNHEIHGEVPRCLYCGWSPDAKLQAITDAGRVCSGTFRSGGTYWPFIFSAVILGSLSLFLAFLALRSGLRTNQGLLMALTSVALFVAGPLMTSIQLLRHRLVWVHVLPDKGLELSGRTLIPWKALRSIENYPGLFGTGDSIESFMEETARTSHQSRGTGCLFSAMILRLVFMPVISVISPWYPRVTIHLTTGERIVLRDLEDSAHFAQMVQWKIEERADTDQSV